MILSSANITECTDTNTDRCSPLLLGYTPVLRVTILNTIDSCNTVVFMYLNIWKHRKSIVKIQFHDLSYVRLYNLYLVYVVYGWLKCYAAYNLWLANNKNLFLTPLEAEQSNIKVPAGLMSGEACFPVERWHPLALCSCSGKGKAISGASFLRLLIPFMRAPPSQGFHLLMQSHLLLGFNVWFLVGGSQIITP